MQISRHMQMKELNTFDFRFSNAFRVDHESLGMQRVMEEADAMQPLLVNEMMNRQSILYA